VAELVRGERFQKASVREALNGLVELAFEAVDRFEKTQGKGSVTGLPEFQKLKALYEHKILPLFPKHQEAKALGVGEGVAEGLQEIKKDLDYELLLIQKEDGSSYMTPLVREHFQLLSKIHQLFLEEEGWFRKVEVAKDRVYHQLAKAILTEQVGLIDLFYNQAFKFKNHPFIQSINKALMALMLCGNSRNLRVNTTGKSCEGYYRDFHLYLRAACMVPQNRRGGGEHAEHFLHTAKQLHAHLCQSLFVSPLRQEFIRQILIEESQKVAPQGRAVDVYKQLQQEDLALRERLKTMVTGPLIKGLEVLKEQRIGFDPLLQGGPLGQLYRFVNGSLDVSVLELPTPTLQESIAHAAIAPEFIDWVRDLGHQGRHHLMINLQNRTVWKERARACALELHAHEGALTVISLDCKTPFYEQEGAYREEDDAQGFMKQCKEQLFSESTGYFLPQHVHRGDITSFVETCLPTIYEVFFSRKARLTQEQRRHFIDIFYLLFILKMAEVQKVDTLSCTDKDGCDDAAVMNALLFALLALMRKGAALSSQDKNDIRTLMCERALGDRARLVQRPLIERMMGTLHTLAAPFEAQSQAAMTKIASLFAAPIVLQEKS
jgi:hypothetical protein